MATPFWHLVQIPQGKAIFPLGKLDSERVLSSHCERSDNPVVYDDDLVTVSLGDIRGAVVEEIAAHCDSVRGYGPALPEFEARLIAGGVLQKLLKRTVLFSNPIFREEDGSRWHSWDGHEWWRGEPDEVTRELTARRIGSLEAAKAVAQNRFRWDRDSR